MRIRSIKQTEWALAILLTAVSFVLLVVRAGHAGGLWRDECGSVQLAQMPTFADISENFAREAFPVPFPAMLRVGVRAFGGSDNAFRGFGLAVGSLLLVVIWLNARLLRNGSPLLPLVLLALNPTFLVWGTSVRGYGIGSVLILLAFAFIAKLLVDPNSTRLTFVTAALVSLASVQFLLYNCVLLAAIGIAVLIGSAIRRQFRPALAIAGVGLLCAASMLPYVDSYARGSQWNMLQKGPLTISLIWKQLALAFGDPWQVMTWVWPVLFLATVVIAAERLYLTRRQKPVPEWDRLLFGISVSIASIVGYYAFLKALSYGTRPWYYLALLSLLAGAIDLIVSSLCWMKWVRFGRLFFAAVALIVLPFADWSAVIERQTNIDLIARKLKRIVHPNDLIIVNPWWLGISFNRYYHAAAPWATLPTMSDHRIHRFDLVKAKMLAADPIGDLREMTARTLQSGNRVWFVGGLYFPQPGEAMPQLPSASDVNFKWNSDVYVEFWSAQLGTFIRSHILRMAVIAEPARGPVNPLEDAPLLGVEGWHE